MNPAIKYEISFQDMENKCSRLHSSIDVNQEKAGSIELLFNYYGTGDIHIQHVELLKEYRGLGLMKNIISSITQKYLDKCTISAEVTHKVIYFSLKEAMGDPVEISNEIRKISEEELLKILPDDAIYLNNGDLDTSHRGFVRWKIIR